ncbi:hypothetical protein DPMN_056834 [Dreissena polymorpha]|uniref:Uncharacterized protein n=1 Tax=Dreissena polymorpha TaxID=45954 RepID=A0A9D4CV48_DREPO|nr:hypothetical protein DPMN_056834 [Dreissena polymorpha]
MIYTPVSQIPENQSTHLCLLVPLWICLGNLHDLHPCVPLKSPRTSQLGQLLQQSMVGNTWQSFCFPFKEDGP